MNSRSVALDLLRTIALLLVIGRHLIPRIKEAGQNSFLTTWHDIGWIGVDLFFVLSGFLIGGLLFNESRKTGTINIGRFLFRRGLKIYPVYFVLLGYTLVKTAISGWAPFVDLVSNAWPCFILVQNYGGTYPWGHTWSLAVEEHFYLLLPFLIVFLARRQALRRVPVIAGTVALICLGLRLAFYGQAEDGEIYTQTHFRLDALMIGVAGRYLADAPFVRAIPGWLLMVLGVLPFVAAGFIPWDAPSMLIAGLGLNSVCFACLVVGITREKPEAWMRGSFVAAGLAYLGKYSYSIYLWHLNAIGWSLIVARKLAGNQPGALTIITVGMAVCLGVGIVLSLAIESPIMAWRDRITKAREGRKAAPAATGT